MATSGEFSGLMVKCTKPDQCLKRCEECSLLWPVNKVDFTYIADAYGLEG